MIPRNVLCIVVLTYNEERNLPECLPSLQGLNGELVVVDSGSTDRTLDIARAHGARILSHPFTSHSEQWRWALDELGKEATWVLGLDADQRISAALQEELGCLFGPEQFRLEGMDGFYVSRRQVFRGSWIRYGGYYPKYLLKLFRAAAVDFDPRDLMDHHFYVRGPTGRLRGDLIEDNQNERDIGFWLRKHLRYAPLHAAEELARRQAVDAWPLPPSLFGTPDQRIMWLKQRWYRMPLYVRPFLYFAYRYFLLLGVLDGKQGLIFHFLHSVWYRLLVDIYLDDLLRQQHRADHSMPSAQINPVVRFQRADRCPGDRRDENADASRAT